MLRTHSWAAALGFAALAASAAFAAPATPVGSWQVTSGEARYSITACGTGSQLCAKLVWLRDDQKTDKNLAVLNKYVVHAADRTGDNKWSGNVVFDGRTYEGTMTLRGVNDMTLRGCSGMLCQTYNLTRI